MSINTAVAYESAAKTEERPHERVRHQEKVLHPERFDGPLPRRRQHITLIRWERSAEGDWTYECAIGQFEGALARIWTVSDGPELREYDMNVWSICSN